MRNGQLRQDRRPAQVGAEACGRVGPTLGGAPRWAATPGAGDVTRALATRGSFGERVPLTGCFPPQGRREEVLLCVSRVTGGGALDGSWWTRAALSTPLPQTRAFRLAAVGAHGPNTRGSRSEAAVRPRPRRSPHRRGGLPLEPRGRVLLHRPLSGGRCTEFSPTKGASSSRQASAAGRPVGDGSRKGQSLGVNRGSVDAAFSVETTPPPPHTQRGRGSDSGAGAGPELAPQRCGSGPGWREAGWPSPPSLGAASDPHLAGCSPGVSAHSSSWGSPA